MNCVECRDHLVALSEKLLGPEEEQQCLAHLQTCAACSAESETIIRLQQRLVARGQIAARMGIVAAVMQRIREHQKPERETIMSKLMKHRWSFGLSAAAVVLLAVALSVTVSPKALGVSQVIEAYNNIRFLHVKSYDAKSSEPNEYWIQCDDQGKVAKARYDLPNTEDGEKLITWTPEKAEIWFKSKNGFRIMQTQRIASMMQTLLDASQPQLVMKKLQEDAQAGKIEVQTQDLPGQPAMGGCRSLASHPQTTALIIAAHKDNSQKEIYYVDRKTDLITRIEYFRLEGTNEVLKSRMEFSDYNVPINPKMFSLQDQLPPDVTIADQLHQVIGVAQGSLTDDQAAAETVRQFFQALLNKDYKQAGLIYNGEEEAYVKNQFGSFSVARIISVGPAEAQTNWVKRGFRVPCKLEIIEPDGHTFTAEPSPYVRPGDDEAHPDHWNITGGVSLGEGTGSVKVLPDNAKYAAMTPEQTARAFFEACSHKDWDEAGKYMPYLNERLKQYLGGLTIVSVGESFTADKYPGGLATKGFPGRFVPYEIQLPPQEINVRVANSNPAKRCVLTGLYDGQLKLDQDFKWSGQPEILTNNEVYAALSPQAAVQAYFDAQAKLDWTEMRKFTSQFDVESTQKQVAMAQKAGMDIHALMPVFHVGEATWNPEQSAWFVKCQIFQTKKWQLAIRNDNPAHRWQVDGGI
jgi:hypothetical protein